MSEPEIPRHRGVPMIEKGTKVYPRRGGPDENEAGEVIGLPRLCQLEGCDGWRYLVRWPDGRRTLPCVKGMIEQPDGSWRIGLAPVTTTEERSDG